MEQHENFIIQWNNIFQNHIPVMNGTYCNDSQTVKEEKEHYNIIKNNPSHVKNCDFWHNDIQKQCFILRLNPEAYAYFPYDVKKQQSLISTLLTTSYSSSSQEYNIKGYYHRLDDEIKNKQGFLNLALIYHPYIYCGLTLNQKSNPEVIQKLMLGLKECKLSHDKIFSLIKAIPLELLKLYLSDKNNCFTFLEVIFDDDEHENLILWNSIKEHLYKESSFIDMFTSEDNLPPQDELKIQKSLIRNIYIYLIFERNERRFISKNLLTSKNCKT